MVINTVKNSMDLLKACHAEWASEEDLRIWDLNGVVTVLSVLM